MALTRNNPLHEEYSQALADVIGVFWKFHKDRLDCGNLAFALEYDPTKHAYAPFDPQTKVAQRQRPIIADFANALRITMQSSWRQYLCEFGIKPFVKERVDIPIPVPESSKRFVDQYALGLINNANELGEQVAS